MTAMKAQDSRHPKALYCLVSRPVSGPVSGLSVTLPSLLQQHIPLAHDQKQPIVDVSQTFHATREDTMTAGTQKDWAGDAQNASKDGEFKRDTNYIDDRIGLRPLVWCNAC